MKTYRKARVACCTVMKIVCAALLFAMVCLAILQVITRYFISATIIWIEELSIYLMVWLCAIGSGWVWMEAGGHIKMDILEHILPKKIIRIMDICIDIVAAMLGVAVIRIGVKTYRANVGFGMSTMGLKECDRFVPIIVGGVIMSLAALTMVVEHIYRLRRGDNAE